MLQRYSITGYNGYKVERQKNNRKLGTISNSIYVIFEPARHQKHEINCFLK